MNLFKIEQTWKENIREVHASEVKEAKLTRWQARLMVGGIEFISLFIFWIILSGRYQLKYLLIGVGASALVTYLTHDLLYNPRINKAITLRAGYVLSCALRFTAYIPWMIWAIIKANIQVAMIIINPKMPIDPCFLQFKTRMTKKISQVTLANSITLTPGTITVDLTDDTYIVHALVPEAASDIESGLMQNKAGAIFGDAKDVSPECSWTYSCRELER